MPKLLVATVKKLVILPKLLVATVKKTSDFAETLSGQREKNFSRPNDQNLWICHLQTYTHQHSG
jgi:hypothetical protein